MNRRDLLKGVGVTALAAALPAPPQVSEFPGLAMGRTVTGRWTAKHCMYGTQLPRKRHLVADTELARSMLSMDFSHLETRVMFHPKHCLKKSEDVS